MCKEVTLNDLLANVQSAAKASDVNLTFTNMRIYTELLKFAKEKGNVVIEGAEGVRFEATTQELAKYCDCSPRMITDTLLKLKTANVIEYITNVPKPSVIVIYNDYR